MTKYLIKHTTRRYLGTHHKKSSEDLSASKLKFTKWKSPQFKNTIFTFYPCSQHRQRREKLPGLGQGEGPSQPCADNDCTSMCQCCSSASAVFVLLEQMQPACSGMVQHRTKWQLGKEATDFHLRISLCKRPEYPWIGGADLHWMCRELGLQGIRAFQNHRVNKLVMKNVPALWPHPAYVIRGEILHLGVNFWMISCKYFS